MKLEKMFEKQKLIRAVDFLTYEESKAQLKDFIEAYFAQQAALEILMAKQLGIDLPKY